MNQQKLNDLQNYDFLAKSFARMCATGHRVDITTITGNMSAELRVWFLERYDQYCKQALSEKDTDARETEMH
ncbi:glycogen synthesis protein GlgS [Superficieibacter electus]|uniref:Glycogen synthesis protein GlgS n=2 Tax=Superficieibacter electus TaxID=2022662 RepID=A0A2P5GJL6_9ENTR|nr:glycogen synthesis protein GlgS [Superficieibacter electus]POP43961.1 glycogen synthesis protein GlgS [Superficieibacter electus]